MPDQDSDNLTTTSESGERSNQDSLPTVFYFLILGSILTFSAFKTEKNRKMNTDESLILQTLTNYMEGGTIGNKIQLRKAFHPSAQVKFIKDGRYGQVSIDEFMEWPAIGKRQERTCRIVSYHFSGNVGSAHLILEYQDFRFIDFFNLIRDNDQWYIVDKVFYREEK